MNVESVVNSATQATGKAFSKAAETVTEARRKNEEMAQGEGTSNSQVQPEELLSKIKSLTEDGLYSVRFESDDPSGSLVVKVVDRATDEVIRQIPPEELLTLTQRLNDLRGNLVDTEG